MYFKQSMEPMVGGSSEAMKEPLPATAASELLPGHEARVACVDSQQSLEQMVGGSARSTRDVQSRILGVFEQFRNHNAEMKKKYPVSFKDLDIKTLCSRELYGYFATYLTDVYKTETMNEHIAGSTAMQYFNGLLNIANSMASKMAPDDAAARIFFTCRLPNAGTEDCKWLTGVRASMKRNSFKRAADAGETMDFSSPTIYLEPHIVSYVKALSLQENIATAAKRKFSVQTLWAISGRAGETAHLTFELMTWDQGLKCIFIEVPQFKTSQVKQIALVPGSNRYTCWFLSFADYLVTQCLDLHEEGGASWLFPDLSAAQAPGTVLSNYLKMHAVKNPASWPQDVSASSIRHGVSNWLMLHMPAEIAVFTTGHCLEGIGAIWEYMDAMCKACIAGTSIPLSHVLQPPLSGTPTPLSQALLFLPAGPHHRGGL